MLLILLLFYVGLYYLSAQDVTDSPPGVGDDHGKFIIAPEWETLFMAGKNLTMFYKNQSYGSGNELIATAGVYLDEIIELEKAVDDNRFRSLDAVWEVYLNGGPSHLKQIPYDKFIRSYNWGSEEINNYFSLVDRTRRVWRFLVEELEILMESQIVI